MKHLRVRKPGTQPFKSPDGFGVSLEEKVELPDPDYIQSTDDDDEESDWEPPYNKQSWDWVDFDIVTPNELEDTEDDGTFIDEDPDENDKVPTLLFGFKKAAAQRLKTASLNIIAGNDDGAFVIIWNDETKKLLLARRSSKVNNPGQWNFFGGGIDKGEIPIKAAVRELKEEAGIRVPSSWLYSLGFVRSKERQLHYFILRVDHDVETTLNFEHDKVKWFELDDVPDKLNKPCKVGLKLLEQNLIELELD